VTLKKQDSATVAADEVLVEISPDKEHVWEALRALLRVGQKDDLESVQRYARGVDGMPDKVRQQASLTQQEIERKFQAPGVR